MKDLEGLQTIYRHPGIAPRLRPGEQMPELPDGTVPTRVDGEIIGVSAFQDGDVLYGNSPYTLRQVAEIDAHRILRYNQALAVKEAENILFLARVGVSSGGGNEYNATYEEGLLGY